MSLGTDRTDLADILSTVPDLQGFEYRPDVLAEGAAYPLQGPLERGPGNDFEVTWQIVIILPEDERKASDWFADHYVDIADALADFGYVERIEPGTVAADVGFFEAMFLTLTKEA